MKRISTRTISVPDDSSLDKQDYAGFLENAFDLISRQPLYLSDDEGIDDLELAHIIPTVPETLIAIYVGINDAVCNKALVTRFLVRHAHRNVFVFDPQVYHGGTDVPRGTIDAREALNGFEPPNETWRPEWTYVMIHDPSCSFRDLWNEKGYVDMIAAKFEDFTMLSNPEKAGVCFYIDEEAFSHPVNAGRAYLTGARKRGDRYARDFIVPNGLNGETEGLQPVLLGRGEKLYVARPDFGPCAHAWSNMRPGNAELAVVNENSAVPLDLVIAKPPVDADILKRTVPAKGSADMTTDWFFRGKRIVRKPILKGKIRG